MHIFKRLYIYILCVVTSVVTFWSGYIYAQSITLSNDWFGSTVHIVDATDNKLALQWTDTALEDELIDVIKWIVNRVLGILALIALLLLMYGGFQMVTAAGNEDQYGQWFKILKNAAIGLAIIWLAWFIISIIFFVINIATTSSKWTDGGTLS